MGHGDCSLYAKSRMIAGVLAGEFRDRLGIVGIFRFRGSRLSCLAFRDHHCAVPTGAHVVRVVG